LCGYELIDTALQGRYEEQMSNMMPGDNSGAEPREHSRRCRTQCDRADHVFDEERGIRLLLDAAADLSYWRPGRDDLVGRVMARNNEAFEMLECRWGHRDHSCNCEDIANDDAESEAEGLLDALEGRR
jgi:hypothetical protein